MTRRPASTKRGRRNQSRRTLSRRHAGEPDVSGKRRRPFHAADRGTDKGTRRPPAIVRPDPEGGYEIIAGHRRHRGSELAELPDMPAIIREMSDEEAIIELVDSNVQREDVLPGERAWTYRMRLEVEKHQGARTDLTSPKISAKFRSDDEIGKSLGISGDTLRNYASLTELIPQLLKLVDEKQGVTWQAEG